MHVLGHSFSQKCKRTKTRPRDLHIRKVSFSGSSSISSGCSLSSSASTASAHTMPATPRSHGSGLAPPPARLHERAFISRRHTEVPSRSRTFYFEEDEGESEEDYSDFDDDDGEDFDRDVQEIIETEEGTFEMEMPPTQQQQQQKSSRTDEVSDYFHYAFVSKRPLLPRSHWSASTIQTLDTIHASSSSDDSDDTTVVVDDDPTPLAIVGVDVDADEDDDDVLMLKASPPKTRPPMRTMDSVEQVTKKSLWKRRGIIFKAEEVSPSASEMYQI